MTEINPLKDEKGRQYSILLLAIIIAGLFLRLHNLDTQSIWLDEGFSILFAKMSVSEIFFAPEENPPLYYIILHWWVNLFGFSEYAVRFPSFMFGVVSIFMIYKIGDQIFDKETGILSAFILGLSAFHIQYSQEARAYSLTALLTLLSMFYFIKILKTSKYSALLGYIVCSTLLIYTHVYGLFILFAQNILFIVLFLYSKKTCRLKMKTWIFIQLTIFLVFVPRMVIFIEKALEIQAGYYIQKPSGRTVVDTLILYSGNTRLYLLLCFLAAISPLSIRRNDQTGVGFDRRNYLRYIENICWRLGVTDINKFLILIVWLLIPIIVPLVISLLSTPVYMARYTIVASLAFYIMAARGISNISHKHIKSVIIIIIMVYSTISIWQFSTNYLKEPWREVVQHIESNAESGDLLLFNGGSPMIPFDYYSKRMDLVKQRFPKKQHSLVNEESMKELIPTIKGHERVWLIISHSNDDRDLIAKNLTDVLNLSYFREFHYDIKVYLFESKLR